MHIYPVIKGLYFGDYSSCEPSLLQKYNIKHIIRVSFAEYNHYVDESMYNVYKIYEDKMSESFHIHFDDAYMFIYKALNNNENVLVHCSSGKSRSPTLVIAYLIRNFQWTYETAYNRVKSRSDIDIGYEFKKQLLDYEKEMFDSIPI